MHHRARTFLFFILICIFCIGTPLVVLFSQGYRFDIKQKKIVQTGALHIKTKPSSAAIAINGKQKRIRSSRFLYSGTVFRNLVPGNYNITISSSSSLPWEKNISIEPSLVTKSTHVALPLSPPPTKTLFTSTSTFRYIASTNDEAFLVSSDKKSLFSQSLNDTSQKQIFPIPTATTTLEKSEIILSAFPSASTHNTLVNTNKKSYVISNGETISLEKPLQTIANQNKAPVSRLLWHPFDDAILFGFTSSANYWIHLPDMTIGTFLKEKIIGWSSAGSRAYFLSAQGTLYEFSTQLQPTSTPLTTIDPTLFSRFPLAIHALGDNRFVIHEPSGILLLIDIPSLHSELVDTAVKHLVISSDASRMAYLTNDNQLSAYSLDPTVDDSIYSQYEKIRLADIPENANPLAIYFANDNWYLVLPTEWGAFITEIDKRLPLNLWVISFEKKIVPVAFRSQDAALIWQMDSTFSASRLLP